jgi:hypothetical protein
MYPGFMLQLRALITDMLCHTTMVYLIDSYYFVLSIVDPSTADQLQVAKTCQLGCVVSDQPRGSKELTAQHWTSVGRQFIVICY